MLQTTSYVHPVVLVFIAVYAIAVLWAIVVTVRDRQLKPSDKVAWIGALVILPAVGFIAWLIVRLTRRQRNIEGHNA